MILGLVNRTWQHAADHHGRMVQPRFGPHRGTRCSCYFPPHRGTRCSCYFPNPRWRASTSMINVNPAKIHQMYLYLYRLRSELYRQKLWFSPRQCLDLTLCVIRFVKSAVGSPRISKVGSFVGCHRCIREHLTTWEHLTTFIMCEI